MININICTNIIDINITCISIPINWLIDWLVLYTLAFETDTLNR